MQKLLIELHYLPCIEYFCHLIKFKQIEIEANEFFEKQSYRSRCYILSANKVQMLSIPVKKQGAWGRSKTQTQLGEQGKQNTKILYKDVQIDYNQNWVNNHWNSIRSAYGKAPYFEFYAEFFREILFKKIKYLFDLNTEMLDLCLKLLQVKCGIEFTERFICRDVAPTNRDFRESSTCNVSTNETPADNTYDMRNVINQKKESKHLFKPCHYQQLFGNKFAANLSIIDLLFCEGGDALSVLQSSEIIFEP
ncbi:MAG: WbqC family protein [Cytophagales bacterium]|nr:WbqC family protein [Cytophagales bacterium]